MMADMDISKEISQLVSRAKDLNTRSSRLRDDRAVILAELEARRRDLKKKITAAQEAGYDPDSMKDDLVRKIDVEKTKQALFESDLQAAEAIIRPMLEEVRKA